MSKTSVLKSIRSLREIKDVNKWVDAPIHRLDNSIVLKYHVSSNKAINSMQSKSCHQVFKDIKKLILKFAWNANDLE